MKQKNCPICSTELITKNVTPCMECGGDDFELDHYEQHDYREYGLYFGERLILCDFCDVDFASYDPTYFGFEKDRNIGLDEFSFIRDITDKKMTSDQYCPKCNYRLTFLNFVKTCRINNENST